LELTTGHVVNGIEVTSAVEGIAVKSFLALVAANAGTTETLLNANATSAVV
jgi:hypothetical protein